MSVSIHSDSKVLLSRCPIHPGINALPGLRALLRAYRYAGETSADRWDFALEIDLLYESGVTPSDLRWLVAKGFVEHGIELTRYGDPHRSFDASSGFNFESKSCLVLTESGEAFVRTCVEGFLEDDSEGSDPPGEAAASDVRLSRENTPKANGSSPLPGSVAKPRWDTSKRTLYLGETLVKRFRVPARNQELILEVFEEDGWPEFIDDPLPPSYNICPKVRLHNAIQRLNRHQASPLLRFHGNGNGRGVYWEVAG